MIVEKLKKIRIEVCLEGSFWVEDKPENAKRISSDISRYVKEKIKDEIRFIPYKEYEDGEEIDCCTKEFKILKFKSKFLKSD